MRGRKGEVGGRLEELHGECVLSFEYRHGHNQGHLSGDLVRTLPPIRAPVGTASGLEGRGKRYSRRMQGHQGQCKIPGYRSRGNGDSMGRMNDNDPEAAEDVGPN